MKSEVLILNETTGVFELPKKRSYSMYMRIMKSKLYKRKSKKRRKRK